MIYYFSFSISKGSSTASLTKQQFLSIKSFVLDKINGFYPLAKLIDGSVNSYSVVDLLIFIVLSFACFYLFIKLASLVFKRINSVLMSHYNKANYKLKKAKMNSSLMALYKKELKRFFTSTPYVTNMGMGIIILLFLSIACFVAGPSQIMNTLKASSVIKSNLANIAGFIIALFAAGTCTASVSLSLEGHNLWIIQSLPIDSKDIFKAKMLANLVLILPAVLISSVLISLTIKPDILSTVWLFAVPIAYAFFTPVWGMFINQRFARYEWTNETQIIKNSMSSGLGFMDMIFAIIPLVLLFTLNQANKNLIVAGTLAAILIATAVLYQKVIKGKLISDN